MNKCELATVLAALRHWQKALQKGKAQDLMPDHFDKVEPLTLEAIDELCEKLNLAGGTVTVELDNVDWKMLRKQKETLLETITNPRITLSDKAREDLTGILHLLDLVQDQAAEHLGEQTVYGRL